VVGRRPGADGLRHAWGGVGGAAERMGSGARGAGSAAPGRPWAPPLAGTRPLERVALARKDRRAMSPACTRARPGRHAGADPVGRRNRSTAHRRSDGRPCLPIGPCSPTLPRSANSRSRPEAAAPRHIRGDPRAGSVRAERPSAGHRCPVLSLMVALRGEVRALGSADLPPFSTVPRSRRLGNHSRPPDAPELRASEQGP
jgi:hypothetical protein